MQTTHTNVAGITTDLCIHIVSASALALTLAWIYHILDVQPLAKRYRFSRTNEKNKKK